MEGAKRLECSGKAQRRRSFSTAPVDIRKRRRKRRLLPQSKTWRHFVVLTLLAFSTLILQPSTASAQPYSIDWYKIAGGGGTSTGGTYQVSGTIGQPDAGGPMTGGNYSFTGGFWALISVVQTPGAPTLVHQPFRQHGDGLLAERVGLEFAAEQQPGFARRLVGQQRRDDLQRHQLSEPHVADGKFVFPIEAIASLKPRTNKL